MRSLPVLLCLFLVVSCSNERYSDFWEEYKVEELQGKTSNHGSIGGSCVYYWEALGDRRFDAVEIIEFAAENNWKYISTMALKNWDSEHTEASEIKGASISRYFPKQINDADSLLIFETNLLLFDPGTDESTQLNGFAIVSDSGKELTVYHMWGE